MKRAKVTHWATRTSWERRTRMGVSFLETACNLWLEAERVTKRTRQTTCKTCRRKTSFKAAKMRVTDQAGRSA